MSHIVRFSPRNLTDLSLVVLCHIKPRKALTMWICTLSYIILHFLFLFDVGFAEGIICTLSSEACQFFFLTCPPSWAWPYTLVGTQRLHWVLPYHCTVGIRRRYHICHSPSPWYVLSALSHQTLHICSLLHYATWRPRVCEHARAI